MHQRLQTLQKRIAKACAENGRNPDSVRLLAVSKTFSHEQVQQAINLGLRRFGENRAQDLRARVEHFNVESGPCPDLPCPDLPRSDLQWVMIGHTQTNKAKEIARYADELQSLDRWSLAEALHHRLQIEQRVLPVYIQIKTAAEDTKSGLDPKELLSFLARLRDIGHGPILTSGIATDITNPPRRGRAMPGLYTPGLLPIGLMTMATQTEDQAEIRRCFAQLRQLRDQAQEAGFENIQRLSMGMSGDFELAIAEGATDIRVGSALFGDR